MKNKLIILFILIFTSCSTSVEKKYEINNLKNIVKDSISPLKGVNYTTMYLKIKGITNDSVYVKFYEEGNSLYLKGKIDTIFSGDYYGGHNITFIFNPYKANKGKLKLTFGIE